MDSVKSLKPLPLALFAITICFMTMGCEDNYVGDEIKPDPDITHNPIFIGKLVQEIDKELFGQIKALSEAINSNHMWKGFYLEEQKVYFVYVDEQDKPIRGFIMNPHRQFQGAYEIFKSDSYDLNISYYDEIKNEMLEVINATEGNFVLNYKFQNARYHLIKYNDNGVKNYSTARLLVNEAFCAHQGIFGEKWYNKNGQTIIQDNYPMDDEFVALQLLSLAVLTPLPFLSNPDEIRECLAMYVAIRSKELELDQSNGKIIDTANSLERHNGSTWYINNMPSNFAFEFGMPFVNIDLNELTDKLKKDKMNMRGYLTKNAWIDIGASAIFCLKSLGINVEAKIKDGKSPFELANELLSLTKEEKEAYLTKAKEMYGWNIYFNP